MRWLQLRGAVTPSVRTRSRGGCSSRVIKEGGGIAIFSISTKNFFPHLRPSSFFPPLPSLPFTSLSYPVLPYTIGTLPRMVMFSHLKEVPSESRSWIHLWWPGESSSGRAFCHRWRQVLTVSIPLFSLDHRCAGYLSWSRRRHHQWSAQPEVIQVRLQLRG